PPRGPTVLYDPASGGPARTGGPRPDLPLPGSRRASPPGSRPPRRDRGPPPAGRLVRGRQIDAGRAPGRIARAQLGTPAPGRARPGDVRLGRLAPPGRARPPIPRNPRAGRIVPIYPPEGARLAPAFARLGAPPSNLRRARARSSAGPNPRRPAPAGR